MITILIYTFLSLGVLFIFTGALGLIRFKNSASRLHPTTKASAMGLVLILIASMLRYFEINQFHLFSLFNREVVCIIFVLLVSPLAGHNLVKALQK